MGVVKVLLLSPRIQIKKGSLRSLIVVTSHQKLQMTLATNTRVYFGSCESSFAQHKDPILNRIFKIPYHCDKSLKMLLVRLAKSVMDSNV